MRSIRYWSLKYLRDRCRVFIYEKQNPKSPWLTSNSIIFLENWFSKKDFGFEWGSGRSTIWAAKQMKQLISVEHNVSWYENIKKKLKNKKLNNVVYNLFDINNNKEHLYINAINKFEDNYFDYILIDGKLRDECSILALQKVKKGGIIVIDNAERYLPNSFSIPASIGFNFKTSLWNEFYDKIKDNRKYWTTNGVWATLIIFM